ncbi:MAG: hypothetical protein ACPGD8_09385, partial [Flavobacteriales bacterium]
MTGSRSRSRNGSRHAYYHCNKCGKDRYRAELANKAMVDILNDLQLSSDDTIILAELFKRLLKRDDGDRTRKMNALRSTIKKQNARLEMLQDNLADGAISSDEYREIKTRYARLKFEAEEELSSISSGESEKKKLLEQAVSMLRSLGNRFTNADAENKIRILGSIFPEMIEFDGINCRTTSINQALALCR